MGTGYVYDEVFLQHDQPGHPESAERLRRIMATLENTGILSHLEAIPARPATVDELERVHAPRLINQVRRVAESGGGYLDPDTYVTSRSYEAATVAAGGVLRAVEAVLSGVTANAFALIRPPGHHATRSQGMGFCLLNNVAVAVRHALASGQAERVFVADFDVHHGNGTQDIFAEDPAVFYFSVHQYPHYPGTGHWRETGSGPGEGTVLNVPLPSGVGDRGYAQVFQELVRPVAERFRPDLLVVSAGYDAHWSDPLAHMNLTLTGYAALQRELVQLAQRLCSGRVVFALEGGYQLDVLTQGVLNAFHSLLGREAVIDRFAPSSRSERSAEALIGQIKRLHNIN
jgi:acetoin utilization deacetylase AcuC-like enzyme